MIGNQEMATAIRSAVKESGLSQREIAEAFEVSEQAVSGWLRTGKIDKRKLPALASLTRKPLEHFGMGGMSLPPAIVAKTDPDYVRFQLLDVVVGMGAGALNSDHPEVLRELVIAKWEVRRRLGFLPAPDRIRLVTGRGSSMRPMLENGDVAMVDTAITYFDGDAIYAISMHGSAQIKQLQMRPDGLHVISVNPEYPSYRIPPEEGDTVQILGKVLATLCVREM